MAQRLKEEVRNRIVTAAGDAFMQHGYSATRLSDVAGVAGVSTGNLYRYFKNKDALYNEIVTARLAADLLRLLRKRVRELRSFDQWGEATAGAAPGVDALLEFWIINRVPVVILLSGSEQTSLAHVRGKVENELARMAADYLRAQSGGAPVSAQTRFVLQQIFASTVNMIVGILREYEKEAHIRAAFQCFWRYQLAGLNTLLSAADPPV